MKKISCPDYELKLFTLTNVVAKMESGSTEPFLVHGIDNTGTKEELVVKPAYGRIDKSALCKELIGAWLACEIGLNVREPVLVSVVPEFVDSLQGTAHYSRFDQCKGLNFATKFVPGCLSVLEHTPFTEPISIQATEIITFDSYISNVDRGHLKDNVAIKDGNLYVFDHEMAFSFLVVLFGGNTTPWILDDSDVEMLRKHVFFKRYRDQPINFLPILDKFDSLDNVFWTKVDALIPTVWQSGLVQRVQSRLMAISRNKTIFAQQLKDVLMS